MFIALEGPDGSGKTTQAQGLAAWLESRGHDVVIYRDPGSTGLGDRLRRILLERSLLRIGLRAEMLLYMASRAQLVEEVIRPALAARRVVICDRYLLSNVVYQSASGGLSPEEIWRVGAVATGGLLPDLTLLIDVPPEVARARIGTARDRIEDRPESYHLRVRAGFLGAVADYPAAIAVIDGTADAEAVAAHLRNEVECALALDPRS
jgi:dTMP kinase